MQAVTLTSNLHFFFQFFDMKNQNNQLLLSWLLRTFIKSCTVSVGSRERSGKFWQSIFEVHWYTSSHNSIVNDCIFENVLEISLFILSCIRIICIWCDVTQLAEQYTVTSWLVTYVTNSKKYFCQYRIVASRGTSW